MTIQEAYSRGRRCLEDAGSISPALDAGLLLGEAAGIDSRRIPLEGNMEISPEVLDIFLGFIDRRILHEPVAYILEYKDFYKHSFRVSPDVLIPRPETEHLIEAVLKFFPHVRSLLDIGTGSGIIPVTLREELPELLSCRAADISRKALAVAESNAVGILGKDHGIDFIESDIYSAITGRYELIVSNPPYVTLGEYDEVSPDVRDYEPQLALTAGADGMDCYRRIIAGAPGYLTSGGGLVLEVSDATAEQCVSLAEESGFRVPDIIQDYSGHMRVVIGVLQ